MIWKIVLYVLVGYVAIGALAVVFQRRMLYLPTTARLSEDRIIEEGLRSWPSPEDFRGFIGSGDTADPRGTVIVFHGNAGAAHDRDYYARALSAQNLRVILAEYPGYGGRAGHPSEDVLVADALETIRLAHREYGEPLFLWGESLGGGVVSSAVGTTDVPIEGVVLFLAWDSLPSLAQTHYWFLPARWLTLDKYNNTENIQGYEGKVAVVLAEHDEVVPVRHGKRLYDSIAATKRLWLFEKTRHNEFPIAPDLPWWQEVVTFISQ